MSGYGDVEVENMAKVGTSNFVTLDVLLFLLIFFSEKSGQNLVAQKKDGMV